MQNPFFQPWRQSGSPPSKARPLNSVGVGLIPIMVHVTAPADLPAGDTFEALLNGNPERTFTAVSGTNHLCHT
jgi:hypothetical protein